MPTNPNDVGTTTGSDDPNKPVFDLSKDPNFVQMKNVLGGMAKMVQQLVVANGNNSESLRKVLDRMESDPTNKKASLPGEDKDTDDDINDETPLSDISLGQLMKMIRADTTKNLDPLVKPIKDQLDGLTSSINKSKLTDELETLRDEDSNIEEWFDDIKALAKEHPTLGFTDLYNLARSRNPAKKAELDSKVAAEKKKAEEDNPVKTTFGGLTPTSGRTSGKARMNPDEAVLKAWNEVMQTLPTGMLGEDGGE